MRAWSVVSTLLLSLVARAGSRPPKTFVRWLCLRAFVYLSLLQSRNLCGVRLDQVTQAVELGVFLNRCFDGKHSFDRVRYRELRRGLPTQATKLYLNSLKSLETERHGVQIWSEVYRYRRRVLEISLDFLFTLMRVPSRGTLLELCSLIQLIDDVLDQRLDSELGLPTFLFSGGPRPDVLAKEFWGRLRRGSQLEDLPFVLGGFACYLMARVVSACFRN